MLSLNHLASDMQSLFESAEAEREQLRVQLEAVRAVHRPIEAKRAGAICAACSTKHGEYPDFRYFPVVTYPCETILIMEEAAADTETVDTE
ncbi:hypothetical protein GCM10025777_38380 [Membranihabitans marinus]|uniref:DksA C4-type domain-containing protein n=1 Tax=Nesterenkonia rhizosphaerae TaxID=1348272 RepID=A0ABP9G1E2_9MICC